MLHVTRFMCYMIKKRQVLCVRYFTYDMIFVLHILHVTCFIWYMAYALHVLHVTCFMGEMFLTESYDSSAINIIFFYLLAGLRQLRKPLYN